MLVPHDTVIELLTIRNRYLKYNDSYLRQQREKTWLRKCQGRLLPLFPKRDPHGYKNPEDVCRVVDEWLVRLPNQSKIIKIYNGFTGAAKAANATFQDACWWDIDPVKRHIMAIVKRSDGMVVPVLLMWKKSPITAMQRTPEQTVQGHAGWEWHPSLYTWRFAIEGETYYDVIEKFTQWLGKPLSQHPPQFQPRPPQFAFAHVPPYGHSPFPFRPGRFFR